MLSSHATETLLTFLRIRELKKKINVIESFIKNVFFNDDT